MKFKKITAFAAAAMIAAGICTGIPAGTESSSPLSITAEAAGDFTIKTDSDGFKYVAAYKGKGGDIRIPDEAEYIGESVFEENSKITSVTFPANCSAVFGSAFAYCANLKKVVFEGDAAIGGYAFYTCPSLESVTVSGSFRQGIFAYAFADCTSLKTVTVSGDTEEFLIGGNAFANCYSLTSINIPGKCTEIYPGAFLNCFSLTKLAIPANTKINTETNYNSYHFGMYYMVKGISDKTAASLEYPDLDDYDHSSGVADGKTSGYVDVCLAKSAGSGYEITDDIVITIKKFTPKALTLIVTEGSPAEKWAKTNKVKYAYANDADGTLGAPTGFKVSKDQTNISLSWGEVEGADAYRVYMYNEKTGKYETYKNVVSAKCTISGLKKNTAYKFKVAALVKNDGKYVVQNTSKAVSVTTSK